MSDADQSAYQGILLYHYVGASSLQDIPTGGQSLFVNVNIRRTAILESFNHILIVS